MKEFREFIPRGNLVDLAVAVVIGTAFGALVSSMVENLEEESRECPECLSEIPVKARRCAFCTAQVEPIG